MKGKRSGKVTEYYSDLKLRFEGEYLKGKRNGKGKEYYFNGELRFVGEYLNGKKWNGKGFSLKGKKEYEIKKGKGYIKEYNNYDGELIFEGEYLNGERNGRGKEYYDNKHLKFKEDKINEEINEKEKLYFNDDDPFVFQDEYFIGNENEYYDNSLLGFEEENLKEKKKRNKERKFR